MAVFHSGPVLRRPWLFLLTLLAFVLALVTGGILWHLLGTSSVSQIQAQVGSLKPVFTEIRLFLIGLVAIAWRFVINTLHRWGRIDESQTTIMLGLRWRIVAWLMVIELVLGQNLLGQVLTVWPGSRV